MELRLTVSFLGQVGKLASLGLIEIGLVGMGLKIGIDQIKINRERTKYLRRLR